MWYFAHNLGPHPTCENDNFDGWSSNRFMICDILFEHTHCSGKIIDCIYIRFIKVVVDFLWSKEGFSYGKENLIICTSEVVLLSNRFIICDILYSLYREKYTIHAFIFCYTGSCKDGCGWFFSEKRILLLVLRR